MFIVEYFLINTPLRQRSSQETERMLIFLISCMNMLIKESRKAHQKASGYMLHYSFSSSPDAKGDNCSTSSWCNPVLEL